MKYLTIAAASAAILAGPATMAQAGLPAEEVHAGYRETGHAKDWIGIYTPSSGGEARGEAGDGAGDEARAGTATEICAIYSRPKESKSFREGEEADIMRGELAAFISWNDEVPSISTGEISFMVGAPVVEGEAGGHALTVDGDATFDLVGFGDRLYVKPGDDAESIAALRGGAEVVVTGDMADESMIKDRYSLMGVQAVTRISRDACAD